MSQQWLLWAILSTLCYGIYAFLFKKLTHDKGDIRLAQIVMPAVVTVLAVIAFYLSGSYMPDKAYLFFSFAAAQGVLFFFTTESRLKALNIGTPSNVVFPVIKSSTVLVILISAAIFKEWDKLLEPFRLAGVILSVGVMFLLINFRKDENEVPISTAGLKLALLAALSSVGASLAPKYAIEYQGEISIFLFILVSNFVSLLLARIKYFRHTTAADRKLSMQTLYLSFVMGVLSFIGFAAFLKAITHGSLSIVAAVSSLYIIVPVVLSAVLYHETFNKKAQVAVLLSVLAMALISIGK